jgi:hypothetical protein
MSWRSRLSPLCYRQSTGRSAMSRILSRNAGILGQRRGAWPRPVLFLVLVALLAGCGGAVALFGGPPLPQSAAERFVVDRAAWVVTPEAMTGGLFAVQATPESYRRDLAATRFASPEARFNRILDDVRATNARLETYAGMAHQAVVENRTRLAAAGDEDLPAAVAQAGRVRDALRQTVENTMAFAALYARLANDIRETDPAVEGHDALKAEVATLSLAVLSLGAEMADLDGAINGARGEPGY